MFGKLRALWRELGPVDGLVYATDQALARLSGGRARLLRYVIFAQPVGRALAQAPRPDPKTLIEATPQGHALESQFPRPAAVIKRRYEDGAHCISASVAGRFVGHIWWQHGSYEEDEVRCLYLLEDAARCVWDYDVYVEPSHRLGRTLARLWAAVDARLAADGVAWSFSRIATINRASLAAHARLGAVERGRLLFLVLGPLQLAWLPQAPWLHFSLRPAGRPVLRLRAP